MIPILSHRARQAFGEEASTASEGILGAPGGLLLAVFLAGHLPSHFSLNRALDALTAVTPHGVLPQPTSFRLSNSTSQGRSFLPGLCYQAGRATPALWQVC